MAEIKEFCEAIIKYGGYPILLIWVWQLDAEQEEMKNKMFECFEDKEDILKNRSISNRNKDTFYIRPIMVATLPTKCHETKEEYEEDAC